MTRTARAVAAAVVCMFVLAACWEPEDATHRSADGETTGLYDGDKDCIWVFQADGEREILYNIEGGNVDDCIPDVAAPTTTTPTTTTTVPPPTTTTPPTTTAPPVVADFVETFDGNTGLDRFDRGVWHRDNEVVTMTEWSGDHDLDCGSPDTQRTIQRDDPDSVFYMCRDHLMTSVGDTSGYSIAWFSPKQTFNGQTEVSVDVNNTNLLLRQWFEFSMVPADYNSGVEGCEPCISGASAVSTFFPSQPANTFVWGLQGGGQRLMSNNTNVARDQLNKLCNDGANSIDPEGCASKALRRTWTAIDNEDGTVTIGIPELGATTTVEGAFPTGDWKLVIKDHNYTPNKDGIPIGYTWHYDNVIVT